MFLIERDGQPEARGGGPPGGGGRFLLRVIPRGGPDHNVKGAC